MSPTSMITFDSVAKYTKGWAYFQVEAEVIKLDDLQKLLTVNIIIKT